MKIAVGSDHAGFELKEYIKGILEELDHEVLDLGTFSTDPVDYPDFGFKVALAVSNREADRGILFCGTGIGMCIVANKVKGIRASLVTDIYTAIQSRRHTDANILVLGGRVLGKGIAEDIVKEWIKTPFEGGRHKKRIEKVEVWEREHLK